MTFQNPIVGGNVLIRPAIQSPNYSAGISGWAIKRDGSAEFNNLTVRGSFSTGFPPDTRITIDSLYGSTPSVQFYLNPITLPATLRCYSRSSTGESDAVGLELNSGPDTLNGSKNMSLFLDNGGAKLGFNASAGPPFEGPYVQLKHFTTVPAGNRATFGIQRTSAPTVDIGIEVSPSLIQTFGSDIYINGLNTPTRVVDGKVGTSVTSTTGVTTTATNIGGANGVNVPVVQDKAYRCMVLVSFTSTVADDRAGFELWGGTVGVGSHLGQTNSRRCRGAGALENQVLTFVWRAAATTTIANLNLSIVRTAGTGTLTAQVDTQYSMIVEEIGDANMIGGL